MARATDAGAGGTRRAGVPVGVWIGAGLAIVSALVLGVVGAYAGYGWGYAIGEALSTTDPAAGPDDTLSVPEQTPLGHLSGDFPLDRGVTVHPSPRFHVSLADGWLSDSDDPDDPFYIDDDTECWFVVSLDSEFAGGGSATDQSATRAALDGLVDEMRTNDALEAVAPDDPSPVWLDVNDGRGRIELLQTRVHYAFSDSDEQWQSLIVTRAFVETGSVEYAYMDCPAELGADELAGATDDLMASLSFRG